jgi:hypothetical protein
MASDWKIIHSDLFQNRWMELYEDKVQVRLGVVFTHIGNPGMNFTHRYSWNEQCYDISQVSMFLSTFN